MKFIKSISQTFIPFLALLISIFFTIRYFDVLAEKLSNEPEIIVVSITTENANKENFWEFESEVNLETNDAPWKKDSIFVQGKYYYDNEDWNKAESHFLALSNNYPNSTQLLNLLGLTQFKKKDYAPSIVTFKKCLSLDSNNNASHINLAILYVKLNRLAEAERYYKSAISLAPNNPKPHLNLGILYCKTQDWENAKSSLTEAKSLSSGEIKSKALYYSGLAHLNLKDTINARLCLDEAILLKPTYILPRIQLALTEKNVAPRIEELKKIIRLNPAYAMAYYYLAMIYKRDGDESKAESYFKQAIKSDPRNEDLLNQLAEFYLEQEKNVEAEAIFRQLKQTDSKLPQNYFNLAKIASRKGDYTISISLYDSALFITENNYPEAHLNKGLILRKLSNEERAIYSYLQAIKYNPKYAEAYYNLAIAYQKLKQEDKAIASYVNAITIDDTYSKAWYNLGVLYSGKNKLDSSVYCYENAIKNKSNYLKALVNLGTVLNKQDKPVEAIKYYQKAIEFYPNYTRSWFNVAIAYKKNGNDDLAIAAYEKVLSLEPNDSRARKNLGVLYSNNGKADKAIEVYRDAIDINPSDYELRYNLALQFLNNKQVSEAISELSKAIQLNSAYEKGYTKLYEIYFEINEIDKAANVLSDMLIRIPDKDMAYNMGREWHKRKNYEQALVWYDKAIGLGKNNYWIYYWMGMAFNDNNDLTKAEEFYNKSLLLNASAKFTHLRIGELLEAKNKSVDAKFHFKKVFEIDPEFARSKNIAEKIN